MLAHQLDFFLGDAAALRDRPLRTLAAGEAGGALPPGHPHHAVVRGMAAFGLEECGDYAAAEDHGLAAVARNPDDAWAVHAVAHVHEMRGDLDAGLRFLDERRVDWEGALLAVHVAWHEALYLLDAGRAGEALAAYDRRIHHAGSQGVPLELLDASALLWRLRLDGIDAGDRWARLADAWAARAGAEPWYAFNDAHAVMALAGAGRLAEARAWLDRLAAGAPVGADVALPAGRALVAVAEGRPGDAVDDLLAVRGRLHGFGGSHAQRDAWERTLLDAALADGRLGLAAALLDERLAARPAGRYARTRGDELARRRAG
jgi:tetratricopeptide (TPR) repeat protein